MNCNFKKSFLILLLISVFYIKGASAESTNTIHFYSKKKAIAKAKDFKKRGFKIKTASRFKDIQWHYLFAGPFKNKNDLKSFIKVVKKKNTPYILLEERKIVILYKRTKKPKKTVLTKLRQRLKKQIKYKRVIRKTKIYSLTLDKSINNKSLPPAKQAEETLFFTGAPAVEDSTPSRTEDDLSTTEVNTTNWSGHTIFFPQFFLQSKDSSYPLLARLNFNKSFNSKNNLSFGVTLAGDLKEDQTPIIDTHSLYYEIRKSNYNITLGAQVLSWGRVFDGSIISGLNRQLLSYGPRLNLGERSLDQWAARLEYYKNSFKADVVFIPYFRPHHLNISSGPWTLLDQESGNFIYKPENDPNDTFKNLIQLSRLEFNDPERLVGGLRLTRDFSTFSLGFTALKSPSLEPYFVINPQVINQITQGQSPELAIANSDGATLRTFYPGLFTLAIDGLYEMNFGQLRFELGYEKGTPVTTENYLNDQSNSLKWNLSLETYLRGERDTLNLIFGGQKILYNSPILDFSDQYYFTARYLMPLPSIESTLTSQVRLGLHTSDDYYSINLSYNKYEPHLFNLTLEYFTGDPLTMGYLFEQYSNASLSWKYNF